MTRRPPAASSTVRRSRQRRVERIQTGVRLEKRLHLVLKALAGTFDLSLGDLLEGIVLHAFEGKAPFGKTSLARIEGLRKVYDLDLTARDSHRLTEQEQSTRRSRRHS